jgi:hypothetical protein
MNTKARINKKLIILGKAPVKGTQGFDARVDFPDCEVWTVGTHRIENADRYYEFHGLPISADRPVFRDVSDDVKAVSSLLPVNNSISAMLLEAYFEGYRDIEILGCPMIAKDEYQKQKPALAMCIGFCLGNSRDSFQISWDGAPELVNYYERYQK